MNVFHILIKDIKNILYDRKTLALILIMPIILMSILGASLQGMMGEEADSGIREMDIAIVKEYDGEKETEKFTYMIENNRMYEMDTEIDINENNPEKIFFDDFLGSKDLDFIKYKIVSKEEGLNLLEDNKIIALVVLPKNFVYDSYVNMYMPGRNVIEIDIIKNPNQAFIADIIDNIIRAYTNNLNLINAQKFALIDIITSNENIEFETAFEELFEEQKMDNNVSITKMNTNKKDTVSSFQYYAAAIMGMFLLYTASIGGKAFLDEKKEHTMSRLTATGTKVNRMLISNFMRIMILAFIQSTIMIVYSNIVLGVNWGDTLTILITILLSGVAVGGLGMLVSSIAIVMNNYNVVNLFEFVVVNFMALVGGSFIPIEILPKALRSLNFLSINGIALKMYMNGMYYNSLSKSITYISLLLMYAVIFSILAFIVIKLGKRRQTL